MSAFLEMISTFFTQALTWASSVMTTILGSPALVVLVLAMPIAGYGVGLIKRLIRL